jgi:phospholipase C
VCSEVFDHTSLIRFIEQRFGVLEPNITTWRRAVAGDLTSAFDFRSPNDALVPLPSTDAYAPPDNNRHPDVVPTPPSSQAMPKQERGVARARAVPYELNVGGHVDADGGKLGLRFTNSGKAAAVFQVRSGNDPSGPWTYTVGAHDSVDETWNFKATGQAEYDLTVYGPNGFLRGFEGGFDGQPATLDVRALYEPDLQAVVLQVQNGGARFEKVRVHDAYRGATTVRFLDAGETFALRVPLDGSFGWYDLSVSVDSDARFGRRVAGHLETGAPSMTDPAIGG